MTPNLSYLKTFGCKGFSLNKTPGKGKFQPRARECIFLGYSDESKGYRVWLTDEKKVEVTRDIKFINEFLPKQKFKDFISEEVLEKRECFPNLQDKNWIELEVTPVEDKINHEVRHEEENSENEEDFRGFENVQERRLPGRPKTVRTGNREGLKGNIEWQKLKCFWKNARKLCQSRRDFVEGSIKWNGDGRVEACYSGRISSTYRKSHLRFGESSRESKCHWFQTRTS